MLDIRITRLPDWAYGAPEIPLNLLNNDSWVSSEFPPHFRGICSEADAYRRPMTSTPVGWKFPKFAAPAIGILLFSPCAQSDNLVDSALGFFLGNDSNTARFDLDKARPQPATPEFKANVLHSLPKEGRVTKFKEPQLRKLASLDAILQLHQRQSVYDLAVFESAPKPFAFIGLHQRAVLLISDAALDLLDAEELQATVAHEIGHEYVWTENLEATKHNDVRRLKELELICDGVAILTLRRAGVGPAPLLTATEKITNFNLLSTGQAWNAERYPSAGERRRFAEEVVKWADARQEKVAGK
jgi:hypothetical protein